jgi:hypothetical protein
MVSKNAKNIDKKLGETNISSSVVGCIGWDHKDHKSGKRICSDIYPDMVSTIMLRFI